MSVALRQLLLGTTLLSSLSAVAAPLPPPPPLDPSVLQALRKPDSKEARDARIEAFRERLPLIVPASPEEAAVVVEKSRALERQAMSRSKPKAVISRDIVWSLGSPPPELHMANGYVTTLLFYDAEGSPLPLAQQGVIVGDQAAIGVGVTDNAVVLSVKQPWMGTNLAVFLKQVPVPLNFTLDGTDDPSETTVDYQVRVRVLTGVSQPVSRNDLQNMDLLLQLVNGLALSNPGLKNLPIARVEQGYPAQSGAWTTVNANLGAVRVGPDGNTYVVLQPGLQLVAPAYQATLVGADGSRGYIVPGNNPRILTVRASASGVAYRITIQR